MTEGAGGTGGGASGLLRACMFAALPRDRRDELLGEMDDLFARQAARVGRVRAHLWYAKHVLGFAVVRLGSAVAHGFAYLVGAGAIGLRDMRLGARTLARRPGYSLASVLTLGIGIGGVVAVYSVANWVLLRPVPGVPDGAGLATVRLEIREAPSSPAFPISELDRRSLEATIPSIEALEGAAYHDANIVWVANGDPDRRTASVVSSGFFEVLGMRPEIGRLLTREDNDGTRLAVISSRVWRAIFPDPRGVLGAKIQINGHPYAIVGVAASGFQGAELPGSADIWIPAELTSDLQPGLTVGFTKSRGTGLWTDLVARMADGAALTRVPGEGAVAIQRVRDEIGYPNSFMADFELRAFPGLGLSPMIREPVTRTLKLLSAAALTLLLLAIANVANLALTHSAARSSSVAVHTALGASLHRLIARGLVEHALLGIVGALIGVSVALVGVGLFREGSLSTLGATLDGLSLDKNVFAVALLVAVGASVLAGIGPTVGAARLGVARSLQGHRSPTRGMMSLQHGLVILQVSLSTILLVSAGLLAQTALNLRNTNVGFEPDRAVRFSVDPGSDGYEAGHIAELADRVVRRLRSEPGVEAAGFVYPALIQPRYLTSAYYRSGGDPKADLVQGGIFEATDGLLPALGVQLVAGRLHRPEDREADEALKPVVVTRTFAEMAFPESEIASVLGRTLVPAWGEGQIEIVGVIDDLRLISLSEATPPMVFVPWGTLGGDVMTAWVRTTRDPSSALPRVYEIARETAPTLPIFEVRTGRDQVDGLVVEDRVLARLAVALATLGLVLAGIGLQGVLAYHVLRRRKEMGIRMALGAPTGSIQRAVIRRSVMLTAVGLVIGALATLPIAALLASRLHGVAALDPATYISVVVGLLTTAFIAASVPALRSTRVDARDALMSE